MRYFGGKQRISKRLAEFLNSQLEDGQPFVDAFCGSCNVVSKIDPERTRIANDKHPQLIEMWKHFQTEQDFPERVDKEYYYWVKENGEDWLKGFIGFGMSFGGKWWGGFTGEVSKNGQDYLLCAKNGVMRKIKTMEDVKFTNEDYSNIKIPNNSLIYCDIPYKDTTQYCKSVVGEFDHFDFWEWCRELVEEGHTIMVSEYEKNVPDDATVLWRVESGTTNAAWQGSAKKTVEVIYTFN